MTQETYGNSFRSGEKNIDDLHRKVIQELIDQAHEDKKFEYIFADVCRIMQDLGWESTDTIITQIAGTLKKDKFIVIKNENLNPRPNAKVLPEGTAKPVAV
jgi:hypothetical protein